MSILYLHYDKFYILGVVLTLYGLTERIINELMNYNFTTCLVN